MGKSFGLVIDLRKCIECHACAVGCKIHNQIEIGKFLTQVLRVKTEGAYPDVKGYGFPRVCMQCKEAPCAKVCPTKATHHDERGIVRVDEKKCVGCKYCMIACPYGARSFNSERKVVQKCELCVERLEAGRQPVCVDTCPTSARVFGDLNDPGSEAAKVANRAGAVGIMLHLGTRPVTRYCAP